jgi:hypothetical protein
VEKQEHRNEDDISFSEESSSESESEEYTNEDFSLQSGDSEKSDDNLLSTVSSDNDDDLPSLEQDESMNESDQLDLENEFDIATNDRPSKLVNMIYGITVNEEHPKPSFKFSNTNLTKKEKEKIKTLMNYYKECFKDPLKKLRQFTGIEATISIIPGAELTYHKGYHVH